MHTCIDTYMHRYIHLFVQNISRSLHKLRQYSKNLTKYQTKTMCSEAVLQRSSSRKMIRKYEVNLQENHAEV